jgi:hypothetical protein
MGEGGARRRRGWEGEGELSFSDVARGERTPTQPSPIKGEGFPG